MDGKTALGASSPAKPALHMPDPLSMTKAAISSSHMMDTYGSKNNKSQLFENETCKHIVKETYA